MSEFNSCIEALSYVQANISAPKARNNAFGKFNYRSAEDILSALKEVIPQHATLIVTDDICLIGDRYYVKATAIFTYKDKSIETISYAREPLSKKGNDESQITGAASSYARKYALAGLLMLDDSKDADSQNNNDYKPAHYEKKASAPLTAHKKFSEALLQAGATKEMVHRELQIWGINKFENLKPEQFDDFYNTILERIENQ